MFSTLTGFKLPRSTAIEAHMTDSEGREPPETGTITVAARR
ncbi:hypothetical protein [Croceicoccus mobilis]|nr:hypothetical protein [Croceicoccus mobilis]